jgi:hypothetical protein
MTKNIELWDDDNQNQIWGQLTDDNKISLWADSKDVIVGELQGNKLDLAPQTQACIKNRLTLSGVDSNSILLTQDVQGQSLKHEILVSNYGYLAAIFGYKVQHEA